MNKHGTFWIQQPDGYKIYGRVRNGFNWPIGGAIGKIRLDPSTDQYVFNQSLFCRNLTLETIDAIGKKLAELNGWRTFINSDTRDWLDEYIDQPDQPDPGGS